MCRTKNEIIKDIVYKYAELSKIIEKKTCDDLVVRLLNLDINDAIDNLLVSLDSLLSRKVLTLEQILSNVDLILSLNSEKYKTVDDLIKRLEWIKSMNMEYPEMPLSENHRLVIEVFDKFNSLVGTTFDSFYTGGLMCYLATEHQLERYHSDLDLFVNEEQLLELYDLVEQSEDFEFVSNMGHKEENGHEFKIVYKDGSISIGLFLFERLLNGEMVLKEYFYSYQDKINGLVVNESHLTRDYASLLFPSTLREYNGNSYRMQSLEGIFYSKRDSRLKDKYDAKIIEDYVDMEVVRYLNKIEKYNIRVKNKYVNETIVQQLDELINKNEINIL